MAQSLDRRRERKPLDRHDVFRYFIALPGSRLHQPELHYLWPAACQIGDGTEKFRHFYAKAGLFHDLAPRAANWTFAPSELTARQYPKSVLAALDDRKPPRPAAHHDPPCRAYGLAQNSHLQVAASPLVSQNMPVHEAQIGPHSRLLTTRATGQNEDFLSPVWLRRRGRGRIDLEQRACVQKAHKLAA